LDSEIKPVEPGQGNACEGSDADNKKGVNS